MKKVLRKIIPPGVRLFLWRIIPRLSKVNNFVLRSPQRVEELFPIDDNFTVRTVDGSDEAMLRRLHLERGRDVYRRKVEARLAAGNWIGMAAVDTDKNRIAYLSWVVSGHIAYFEEFGFESSPQRFLLKDVYCSRDYRHMGLHTRVEQERINYCIEHGATEIYIQILATNNKGNEAMLKLDFQHAGTATLIQWSAFNVYRELWSFLRRPFKRIVG